jgi:hypothetical protein
MNLLSVINIFVQSDAEMHKTSIEIILVRNDLVWELSAIRCGVVHIQVQSVLLTSDWSNKMLHTYVVGRSSPLGAETMARSFGLKRPKCHAIISITSHNHIMYLGIRHDIIQTQIFRQTPRLQDNIIVVKKLRIYAVGVFL